MPFAGNSCWKQAKFPTNGFGFIIFFCEELLPDDKGIIYKIASFLISEWAGRFLM